MEVQVIDIEQSPPYGDDKPHPHPEDNQGKGCGTDGTKVVPSCKIAREIERE